MARYIELPLETDPDTLVQDAFDYIQTFFPDWQPSDGNLEVLLLAAIAQMAAEARDVASDVPASIFRYFGETVMQIPAVAAARAEVPSTWTAVDTAGYTIEAGTLVGIPKTGDELIAFEVESDVVIAPGSSATAAGGVQLVALEAGADANLLSGAPVLIDTLDFVSSVVLVGATGGGEDGETEDEYLDRLSGEMQLLSPRPVLAAEFAALTQRIPGVDRATAVDNYNYDNNLLTANQSSVETNTTGFEVDQQCTIARTTAEASDGAASLRITATAGSPIARTPQGTGGVPVTPGQLYTARADFRAVTVPRNVVISIRWFTAGGAASAHPTDQSSAAPDSTGAWTVASVSAVAPADAAFAAVQFHIIASVAAENHDVDKIQLREGSASTGWVLGPAAAGNQEKSVTVVAVDEDGLAVSAGVKTAIIAALQAKREWNFVVHVGDPTYTALDFVYTVRALPNYNTATVKAAVDAALTDLANPAMWGRLADVESIDENRDWANRNKVRYLEVAEVINRVPGVDYIEALTVEGGSVDVTLPGVVTLPTFGSVAGTVNPA